MKLETYTTIATCTAISTLSSNYTPSAQGLLPEMFFGRIIIITIIIIFVIIVPLAFFASWLEKFKGVNELPPENFMDLDGDDDPLTKFVKKLKRLFGKN